MRALAIASLFTLTACGAGTAIVEVSAIATPGTVLPPIRALRVVVTLCDATNSCGANSGPTSTPIEVSVDRAIPPGIDFALAFDKSQGGPIWIDLLAIPQSSSEQAVHAGVVASVEPSNRTSATVKLTGGAPPDMTPLPPDMSPPPACDPIAQSGCGSITQKCTSNGRCETSGNVGIAQPCTKVNASDNCSKGLACDNGICREMCFSDGDCDGPYFPGNAANQPRCVEYLGFSPHRCSTPCNPVSGDGCPSSQMCLYSRDTTSEFTTCVTPGTATGDCSGVRCMPGYSCVVGGTTGTTVCRLNCLLNDSEACPVAVGRPPMSCVAYRGTGSGALGYGFCCPTTGC